jgi:hypothetical protein
VDGETTRTRVFLATALAGAAHLVLDGLASRLEWTTPPYLLLDHASETFRDLLNLDRPTILVAVSVISAGVNGAIAGLFAAALDGVVERRTLKLGIALSALWIFSGGLMTLVYLSPPAGVVVGSLLAGIPRSFAVAWLLDRAAPREDASARSGDAGQAPPAVAFEPHCPWNSKAIAGLSRTPDASRFVNNPWDSVLTLDSGGRQPCPLAVESPPFSSVLAETSTHESHIQRPAPIPPGPVRVGRGFESRSRSAPPLGRKEGSAAAG